ncbi:hypothetical protein CVT25_001219, partial [Psilocybe cyanescens]
HSKLPIDVRSWKKTLPLPLGSVRQTTWDELRPLLQRHGYRFWTVTTIYQKRDDDKFSKYPGYTFLTPHKLKNASLMNWNHFLALNGISHAARRLHDLQDVILRVITADGQDILISNDHTLPILHEIIYQDIAIVAVPKLMFDLNRFLRSRYRNSLEDVLYIYVFEGTAYLHRNLIAHRDLFPANIMVEWMPQSLVERSCMSRPCIYIIDFETTVDFLSDSIYRKSSEFPFNMSEYGRPVAPELSNGQPYCPFRLDMWQLGIDLHSEYHDLPTADEAMQMLDGYLRKTPPSELHRPGPESDAQEPIRAITQPVVPSVSAPGPLTVCELKIPEHQ